MKAVVVEVKGRHVAVLSDDGIVSTVKNNNYQVGQVIEMKERIKRFTRRWVMLIASIAAVVFLFTLTGFAYYTPAGYVSLDVNPSIEYSINIFYKVIDVQPVNNDAKQVIKDLKLLGKSIDDAIALTIDLLANSGYLTSGEDSQVVISASSEDVEKAQKLALQLEIKAQQQIDEKGITATVQAVGVGKVRVEEAKKLGITPGKLRLIEKLKESAASPENIDVNEWINKPVKEINKAIKENKKANKAAEKSVATGENEDDKKGTKAGENKAEITTNENKPEKATVDKSEKKNENNKDKNKDKKKDEKKNDNDKKSEEKDDKKSK